MSRVLHVRRSSPGMTVQDLGRPGHLTFGISKGGAADPIALHEGAALLGQDPSFAALEMAQMGGEFSASEDLRIALTGAPMRAALDDERLAWNASHLMRAGSVLSVGPAESGVYGYLSVGGGVATPEVLGSRSTHLSAGIGRPVMAPEELLIGPDAGFGAGANRTLPRDPRFDGGLIRMVASLQTDLFAPEAIARFQSTVFRRDTRSNRMGARLSFEGEGFSLESGLSILSEVIVPGDIQITGDGTPFVLMSECQTVGGYPRIGSVLPSDLPRVAQAPAGASLKFAFVSLPEAEEIEARAAKTRHALPSQVTALIRDPREIRDLLSYQLISGVVSG